jgi:hypothetical protein
LATQHVADDVVDIDAVELEPLRSPLSEGRARETALDFPTVGVDFAGVEFLALLLVAQEVERGAGAFETFLRGLVARIDVRMVGLGQLVKSLADFPAARSPRYA